MKVYMPSGQMHDGYITSTSLHRLQEATLARTTLITISRGIRTLTLGAGALLLTVACSTGEAQQTPADSSPSATPSESVSANTDDDANSAAGDDDANSAAVDDAAGATADASGELHRDTDVATTAMPFSAQEAYDLALATAGGGFVHDINLDFDDDRDAWEYDVAVLNGNTEFTYEIDARSGDIVSQEEDGEQNSDEVEVSLTDPLALEDALSLAQEHRAGALEGWDLDSEEGTIRYEFDYREGQDITINVETSDITER